MRLARQKIADLSETGAYKARLVEARPIAFLAGAAMAGVYLGIGDVVLFTLGSYVGPAWSHVIMSVVLVATLTIVVSAGSELFIGAALVMPLAVLTRLSSVRGMLSVWFISWIGNLVGALSLAALVHFAGGGDLLVDGSTKFFSAVEARMSASAVQLLVGGALCNWLVCLAISMGQSAKNTTNKILVISLPIGFFVVLGLEALCVANMFTFALALIGDHPKTVTLTGAAHNLGWLTLGNLIGALAFAGPAYWLVCRKRMRLT
ncbi:formate/nitrite transporter family protein [Rhizobium cauense]|uniref:formate/nitrite transporter family protein n=1 Tax=Rhizobium cauense TaxID=1166683 RepID=UPI001C6EF3B4|nr:formate/nitrite transporter family protein [Rhizobium cauense]MBW9116494.1 formate/nitrite transporter family protein [Rhizobium cauense]